MNKLCKKCSSIKDHQKFNKCSGSKDGLQSTCRECASKYNKERWANEDVRKNAREHRWKTRYGISEEIYNIMLNNQKHRCLICGTDDPSHKGNNSEYFCVDHCHTTGKVRGLLCNDCNAGLGKFKDNIDSCLNAATYLRRNG